MTETQIAELLQILRCVEADVSNNLPPESDCRQFVTRSLHRARQIITHKPGVLTSMMIAQLRDRDPDQKAKMHCTFTAPIDRDTGKPFIVAMIAYTQGGVNVGIDFAYWDESTELWQSLPFPLSMRLRH